MALPIYFSDYVQAELVAAANASQTTILISTPTEPLPDLTVEAGAYTYITVVDQPSFIINQVPPTQREVMKLTAWTTVSSGLSLTVERGITTTAQIWASGSIMELRPCAQGLEDLKDVGTAVQAQYVVMAINAGLTSERVLTAGTNVTITDGGAKGAVTISAAGGGATGATGATGAAGSAGATGATGAAGGTGASGGVLQGHEFTSSGTFNVPLDITSLWITMVGGGGGGASSSTTSGSGSGGAGEVCEFLAVLCVSEEAVTVTIGAAGAAGTGGGAGGAGGTTSVVANGHTYPCAGGAAGSGATNGQGGGTGAGIAAVPPFAETNCYFGGAAGGKGAAGYPSSAASGSSAGGASGGTGGANSKYGLGGAGGNGNQAGTAAASTSFGAGGGGSGGTSTTPFNGGAGAKGYVLIQWIGEP